MHRYLRKILSLLFMLGFTYLPYSCSTTKMKEMIDLSVIQEDYDEFAMEDELPGEEEDDFVDEIANDEKSYQKFSGGGQIKIVDFDRAPASIVLSEGGVHTYQVKPFDTLMLISHYVYGDYSRWRELIPLNREHLNSENKIIGRPQIKFVGTPYHWEPPMGQPYFIKEGDSLSIISRKVYGSMTRWREIFENNPRQIKDPNLIFAGFHLYYPAPSNLSVIY